ncbi:MAG: hypothetical protein QM537_03250 [Candidatus Symbiobacter sp.]|nr:hypothetical protein [Candidatus Symbiobacter sp.]
MELVLDETTLIPCAAVTPIARIRSFSLLIKKFGDLGFNNKMLHCAETAPERDIGDGKSLKTWCFDHTIKDEGRLILMAIGKRPSIQSELDDVPCEGKIKGNLVYGLAYAANNDFIAVGLECLAHELHFSQTVDLFIINNENLEAFEQKSVYRYTRAEQLEENINNIKAYIEGFIDSPKKLINNFANLYPNIIIGPEFADSISGVDKQSLRQIKKSLEICQFEASNYQYQKDKSFKLINPKYSAESETVRKSPRLRKLREFKYPADYAMSDNNPFFHLKWNNGFRLYFDIVQPSMANESVKIIALIYTKHLPTALYD